jgi:hypothetical protein
MPEITPQDSAIKNQATNPTPAASANSATTSNADFNRVRLSAQSDDIYGSGIMTPLKSTKGVLFPYTPQITTAEHPDYQEMQMVHANQGYYAYSRTRNVEFRIAAKFTVQNNDEGKYAMAALHFFRTCSRMNFGQKDPYKGLPPPILLLSGYGQYIFNNVRVLLTQVSYDFPDNVDMVTVTMDKGTVRLPALMRFDISLVSQQTPSKYRTDFNLEDYRTGTLLEGGKGWY